jgi:hypothetical protein
MDAGDGAVVVARAMTILVHEYSNGAAVLALADSLPLARLTGELLLRQAEQQAADWSPRDRIEGAALQLAAAVGS